MQIQITNCNNIDSAEIDLNECKLNIKFAPNGTGKSTIAKAIEFAAKKDTSSLSSLLPFKYRDENPDNVQPTVVGAEQVSSVMFFNDEYVNQFTFKEDELISNSFEIFIKTEAYIRAEEEINQLVQTIREQFSSNADLDAFISNLKELSAAFKVTTSGTLSRLSKGMKALSGNKLVHIPEGLEEFQPFIQGDKNVAWIDWQTKGHKEFSDISHICPFCSSDKSDRAEKISKVSQEYDKTVVQNLISIINVVEKLGTYFAKETRNNLDNVTSLPKAIEQEHEDFLISIKSQIDNLVNKLERLKSLSGFYFREDERVVDKLQELKIELTFFSHLKSEKTESQIEALNQSIDDLSEKAGLLQGSLGKQRSVTRKLIEKYQKEINEFLAYAGYKYCVEIVGDGAESQLKLVHIEFSHYVQGGRQHLSYGERNAFAIVLFMYECLSKKPDLIILDDPISSFDKNKKFAIIEKLFMGKTTECLAGDTVLMLTHDVEPIIDTVKSVKEKFSNKVVASYLRFDQGVITEKSIFNNDIKTFVQICKDVLDSEANDVIKLIYLRRYFEIVNDLGDAYQVLSNLLHRRDILTDQRIQSADGVHPSMANDVFSKGLNEIKCHMLGFEYNVLLDLLKDSNSLKALYKSSSNGYEKLQIFRLMQNQESNSQHNSVIRKFVNETYHIENEFICQLDPRTFDLIPSYVIEECDKLLELTI
jgi:energy-coupling factor transporter ATP-binding protein EcfA2